MTALSCDDVRARVRDLPALPSAVSELIASLADELIGVEQLSASIARDQALVAKTLRLANSSFYGMSRQVVSVADATAILGLQTVRSVAIAAGLTRSFAATACPGFDFEAFWRHSVATALCAQALAPAQRFDGGVAFALGLLHDIGRLVLVSHFAPAYADALAHQRAHDLPTLDAERQILGLDHAAIGALVAEHWRFAPAVVEAIAWHHEPPAAPVTTLADVVHVADNFAHALDLSGTADDAVPILSIAAWYRLGLDEAACLPIFRMIEAEHASLCAALLA